MDWLIVVIAVGSAYLGGLAGSFLAFDAEEEEDALLLAVVWPIYGIAYLCGKVE